MDPDQNLKEARHLAAKIILAVDRGRKVTLDDAERLAELVESLDEWIAGGGFLPKRWKHR